MAYNWALIRVSYHDELGPVCGGQWLRQWWGRPRRIGVQCARAAYKIHRNIHHNYRNDGQRSHTCKYNIYREVEVTSVGLAHSRPITQSAIDKHLMLPTENVSA